MNTIKFLVNKRIFGRKHAFGQSIQKQRVKQKENYAQTFFLKNEFLPVRYFVEKGTRIKLKIERIEILRFFYSSTKMSFIIQ